MGGDQIHKFTEAGGPADTDGLRQTRSKWIRRAVLVITGLESMAMFAIAAIIVSSGQLSSGEALSRYLGWAILAIYGLPYLIMAVPALLLAALNRHLPAALALSLLVIPLVWLFWRYA
jgi:Kef-type K+ transport system membrane component KefB